LGLKAVKPENVPKGVDKLAYLAAGINLEGPTVGLAPCTQQPASLGVEIADRPVNDRAPSYGVFLGIGGMEADLDTVELEPPEHTVFDVTLSPVGEVLGPPAALFGGVRRENHDGPDRQANLR
jgi:hypothetical protein